MTEVPTVLPSPTKENGAARIIRFNKTVGLARAFKAGIEDALRMGADIIVNTDADNQYDGTCIRDLVKPILDKKADIVIGNREILKGMKQGITKSMLQFIGSCVVSKLAGIRINDATSGFRAFSREAALSLNISTDFSYTLESIIQAGEKGLVVTEVAVRTNGSTRRSRLFKSKSPLHKKVRRDAGQSLRGIRRFQVFLASGSIMLLSGIVLGRKVCLFSYIFSLNPSGHIQSLIFASALITAGFLIMTLGILTELICSTRKVAEDALTQIKKNNLDKNERINTKN
jgi:hypothetical protein